MNQPFVRTNLLTKRFRELTALDQCTLSIPEGEVFGLLGPNGAGKSTLLRLLLGFLNPSSGSATIGGHDCQRERIAVLQKTSYLPGDARLYRIVRGKNLLKLLSRFRQDSDFKKACEVAERLELDLSRWVGLMSTGMRQKLALAICLSNQAPLLILDEPTANLDPSVRATVMEMVLEAKAQGKTIIFSSHVLSEIEEICDQVGILRRGKLVHVQVLEDLKRQHRITACLSDENEPVIPPEGIVIKRRGEKIQLETPGELSTVLRWLADANLTDVYVSPIGLRSVYDRFHFENRLAPTQEVAE